MTTTRAGFVTVFMALAVSASALAQPTSDPSGSDPSVDPATDDFPREGSSFDAPPPPTPGPVTTSYDAPTPAETAVAPTPPAASEPATPQPAEPAADAAAASAESDSDDDGERSRHFWFDIGLGYSWINLVALDQSNFAPEPKTLTSTGPTIEGGFGVSLSIIRLGLAGCYARYESFDVATAELDLTLVIPTPLIEPYIEVGVGYGWVRNVDETNTMTMEHGLVPIRGVAVDLGLGLDIHLSDLIQLGVNVDASLLNLQRQRVTDLSMYSNVDFTKEGTSLGLQVHGMARLTFQF